jgi:hypothetical protein
MRRTAEILLLTSLGVTELPRCKHLSLLFFGRDLCFCILREQAWKIDRCNMNIPAAFSPQGRRRKRRWHESLACLSERCIAVSLFLLACMNFLGAFFGRDICIRPRACKMAGYLFVQGCLFILGFTATLHLCDSPTLYYYYGRMINVFFFLSPFLLLSLLLYHALKTLLSSFLHFYTRARYHHHYCYYTYMLYIDTYPCTSNEST